MDNYLMALGWWNFVGAILMFALLKDDIGHKILVEWSAIFKERYQLGFYGKLWLAWAAGINVFFGWVNIKAASWDLLELKSLLATTDVVAYLIFISLSIWGLVNQRCGVGIYVAFVIFSCWAGWGIWVLM